MFARCGFVERPFHLVVERAGLVELVADRGEADSAGDGERETGVVLHMVSALAVAGRIGLTAVGDTLDEARAHYYEVKAAVDEAAGGA